MWYGFFYLYLSIGGVEHKNLVWMVYMRFSSLFSLGFKITDFFPAYFSYYFILFSFFFLNFSSYLLFYVLFYSVAVGFSYHPDFFGTVAYSNFDLFGLNGALVGDRCTDFTIGFINFGPYTLFLFRTSVLILFLVLLAVSAMFLRFVSGTRSSSSSIFFWLSFFLNWAFSIQLRRIYFSSVGYFFFYPFFDLFLLSGFVQFAFFLFVFFIEIFVDRFSPSFPSLFEVNAMNDRWTVYHMEWRKYGLWQVNQNTSDLDPIKRMGVPDNEMPDYRISYRAWTRWTPFRGKWMPPVGMRPTFIGPGLDWIFKYQWKEVPPTFEEVTGNAYRAADFLEMYHHAFKKNYPWRPDEVDWCNHSPYRTGVGDLVLVDNHIIHRLVHIHPPCPIYPDPVEFPWAFSRKHCLWNTVLVSYGPAVNKAAGYQGPDGSIYGKAEAVGMAPEKLAWALSDPEGYHWAHEMPDTWNFVRGLQGWMNYAVMSLTERFNYSKKHFTFRTFGSYVFSNIYWTPFATRACIGAFDVMKAATKLALNGIFNSNYATKTPNFFSVTGADLSGSLAVTFAALSYVAGILSLSAIPWKWHADLYGLWGFPKTWDPKFVDEWGNVHNKRVMKIDWWHRLYRWEDPNDHDFDPFSSRTQEQRWRDIPFWYHWHPHLYKPFVHGEGNVFSMHRTREINGEKQYNLPNWWFTKCEDIDDIDDPYNPLTSRRLFPREKPSFTTRQLHADTLRRLALREKYGRFIGPLRDPEWNFEVWGPRTHFGMDVYECPRFQEDDGDMGYSPMKFGNV